jgi:hypothetical protein
MPDDARFCGKCGKAVLGTVASAVPVVRTRLEKHLPVLALLWVVFSVLRIVQGGVVTFVGTMFLPHFFMFGWPFWPFSHFFLPGLITGVGVVVLVLGILGAAAGWGLWQREPWARIVVLILGVIALIHFPFGTALGIYTLWVLLPNESAAEYARVTHPA